MRIAAAGGPFAIEGDVALVGASGADSGSLTDAGAAYLYRLGLTPFSRGDANADGHFNLADAIATLAHLFDGLALSCPRAADMNDDETIDMADVIYGLSTLFDDGPGLPAPLDCNIDPTPGALDCPTFLACP